MLVANSFDMWRKDAFFSAAEEVQESADLMESTYRAWVREMREVLKPEDLNYLSRDLQIALGTAKWQLEEFERAVRLSQGPYGDKTTTARHGQFIAAIRDQISHVEGALQEFLSEGQEGKQPLQWVNLDKEERDDLALFLSGTSKFLQTAEEEFKECGKSRKGLLADHHNKKEDARSSSNAACSSGLAEEMKSLKGGQLNKDAHCVVELEATDQADRTGGARKTCGTPNTGDWKIAIADDDKERDNLVPSADGIPKEKGSKTRLWKHKGVDRPQAKSLTRLFDQVLGRDHLLQRQPHSPRSLRLSYSLRSVLALMLTIFLIVPFVFYST